MLYQTILQYEFVKSYGIHYLFRNRLYLRAGAKLQSRNNDEVFRQLPANYKSEAMLQWSLCPRRMKRGNTVSRYGCR